MAHLSRITVYPVKSLDGLDVPEASVLPSGALENDRRYAVVDAEGLVVNAKRTADAHRVSLSYDPAAQTLTLGRRGEGGTRSFHVHDDRQHLEGWLSNHFGYPVTLVENPEAGFPDDTESPGPTVAADATLGAVAGWFPGLDLDESRRRFRANLEIGGVEPFWDDRLVAGQGRVVRFRVGGVVFEGTNPCPRCVVPSRSSTSGDTVRGFQKQFSDRRRETLPDWADASRFDHFYRLAVNTRLFDRGPGLLRVGDEVEILGDFPR